MSLFVMSLYIVCHVMYMYDISYTCHVCIRPGIGVSGMHAAYGVRVSKGKLILLCFYIYYILYAWMDYGLLVSQE